MKKLYFLMLFTAFAHAQTINIPDLNFKAKLIAMGLDTSHDGEIQQSETVGVDYMILGNSNISDLTGIRSFTSMTDLDCGGNPLTNVDLSGLSRLRDFRCNNSSLTTLNLNGLTSLTRLDCYNDNITSLSLSNLPALNNLNCSDNPMTSLTFTGSFTFLYTIDCQNNNLTGLNVSGMPNLSMLNCRNNKLTDLNFTNCPNLVTLNCPNNLLTSLDFTGVSPVASNYTGISVECSFNKMTNFIIPANCIINTLTAEHNLLTTIDFSNTGRVMNGYFQFNPIETVNIKNGYHETPNDFVFAVIGETTLRFMCVDDNEAADWASAYYPAPVMNSYCSYTPGGSYNTLTGAVIFDANGNGCDSNDIPHQNIRVNINDGTTAGAAFTNTQGTYAFYTGAGTYTLTPALENPEWFSLSPATVTIPFVNANNNTATQNFCLSANGNHPDVGIMVYPTGARPGFDSEYKLVYTNKGNQVLSGNVVFNYDDAVSNLIHSSVIPTVQATGALTYAYDDLIPFESRTISITLNTNGPTETPAVNDGDLLHFTANITPVANDETPLDNTFQFQQVVTNSFDPNDIICAQGNVVAPVLIGNYLNYVVNFENTGTASAQNIVVKDIINTAQFDVSSLQVLSSSATVSSRITGNVAEFIFQNINLQPQAHGNVTFKIKTKNTLVAGNTVTQNAGIYFDYNYPVATAPESTVFQVLDSPDISKDKSISVYPNPTKGKININCSNTIKSLQLFDVQGRLLQTNLVNDTTTSIDISNQSAGIYFLKVRSDKGTAVQKIVRE